jgi:hypothetical protein
MKMMIKMLKITVNDRNFNKNEKLSKSPKMMKMMIKMLKITVNDRFYEKNEKCSKSLLMIILTDLGLG